MCSGRDVAGLIVRGGWPSAVNVPGSSGLQAREYVESITQADVSRVDANQAASAKKNLWGRSRSRSRRHGNSRLRSPLGGNYVFL